MVSIRPGLFIYGLVKNTVGELVGCAEQFSKCFWTHRQSKQTHHWKQLETTASAAKEACRWFHKLTTKKFPWQRQANENLPAQ